MASFGKQIERFRDILEAYPLTVEHVEDLQLLEFTLVEKINALLDQRSWFKEDDTSDGAEIAVPLTVADVPPSQPLATTTTEDADVNQSNILKRRIALKKIINVPAKIKSRLETSSPKSELETSSPKANGSKQNINTVIGAPSTITAIGETSSPCKAKYQRQRSNGLKTLTCQLCSFRTAFGFSFKEHLQKKHGIKNWNDIKTGVRHQKPPDNAPV